VTGMAARLWNRLIEALDTGAHRAHIHCGWLCDLSLGITWTELRRHHRQVAR